MVLSGSHRVKKALQQRQMCDVIHLRFLQRCVIRKVNSAFAKIVLLVCHNYLLKKLHFGTQIMLLSIISIHKTFLKYLASVIDVFGHLS